MTKIIPIAKYKKTTPLTASMIKTLLVACEMQSKNEPFGQKDLDGSFIALLKREFIDAKTILLDGKMEVTWFVTTAGKNVLKNLGFKEAC